jgi:hypothetical protein
MEGMSGPSDLPALSAADRRVALVFLYKQFNAQIERFRRRIKATTHAEEIAWIARSLLELEIWIDYCNSSPELAEQFQQDALRDLNELSRHFDDSQESSQIIEGLKAAGSWLLTGQRKHDNPTYIGRAAELVATPMENRLPQWTEWNVLACKLLINRHSQT